MEVTEALRTSIVEPHDHLHINHVRAFGRSVLATQITRFGRNARGQVGGRRSTISAPRVFSDFLSSLSVMPVVTATR
jgi:hypothetical protein